MREDAINTVAYFEIQMADPERAVRFYSTIFCWRFQKQPGLPIEYWRIETEGICGGLMKRPAPAPPPQSGTNAYVCSMEIANFDSMAAAILKEGGQIALHRHLGVSSFSIGQGPRPRLANSPASSYGDIHSPDCDSGRRRPVERSVWREIRAIHLQRAPMVLSLTAN